MIRFVDSHVHLHFSDYDSDRDEVIERAIHAGIGKFVTVGADLEDSRKALELAKQYACVWASAGIHPHDAKEAEESSFVSLRQLLGEERVVAIGEVGLDFFRNLSPPDRQKTVLRKFLCLQKEIKKPIIYHCRDAYEELLEVIREEGGPGGGGVMHCFSSDRETMSRFLDLGFYISFTGALTYPKNSVLREACKHCPKDRLLLETDAPYLAPQAVRGKRNEPVYLTETAQLAADLRGIPLEALGVLTTANAQTLFCL